MRRDAIAAAWAAIALCALFAGPAHAARPIIGMGDQKYSMFADDRFRWTHIDQARLVVSWNVLQRHDWEKPWIDKWLKAARRAHVKPLVAFGHQWVGKRRTYLPSVAEYRRAVAQFRKRYPWVREYSPWNEANHCSQPTCKRPERAAAYFDVVKSLCPKCTIVAADVLDQRGMATWLRAFQRAAKHKPTIWGLHNYLDANRMRTSGTRHLLDTVKGRVWITETGGVVRRTHYKGRAAFPESAAHAAKATKWILEVAARQPRIDRVYFYHWNADSLTQAWDSGFIDPFGQHRPAFDVLVRALGKNPRSAPKDPVFGSAPAPKPVPIPMPPPPTGPSSPPPSSPSPEPSPEPAPSPSPSPSPSPQPEPPPCLLVIICPAPA